MRAGFPIDYGDVKIFEAYAYYNVGEKADLGTVVGGVFGVYVGYGVGEKAHLGSMIGRRRSWGIVGSFEIICRES